MPTVWEQSRLQVVELGYHATQVTPFHPLDDCKADNVKLEWDVDVVNLCSLLLCCRHYLPCEGDQSLDPFERVRIMFFGGYSRLTEDSYFVVEEGTSRDKVTTVLYS